MQVLLHTIVLLSAIFCVIYFLRRLEIKMTHSRQGNTMPAVSLDPKQAALQALMPEVEGFDTAKKFDLPLDKKERAAVCCWASLIHVSSFLSLTGIPLVQIILPAMLWLYKKSLHSFIDNHGKQAIYFQITWQIITWLLSSTMILLGYFKPMIFKGLLEQTRLLRYVLSSATNWPVNVVTVFPFLFSLFIPLKASLVAHAGLQYEYPLSCIKPINYIKNLMVKVAVTNGK